MTEEITGTDLRNLVNYVEASIPAMQANWRKQYQEGYEARMQDKPRCTHHARRRGMWFRGYDNADEDLKKRIEA